MSQSKIFQVLCLALAAGLLAGAALLQTPINARRADMKELSAEDVEREYPQVKILQAMPGGLRALAIDYLWIRTDRLKQDGRIYDAVQLSNMICLLQARFPAVWANRAWNLAYNISITTHTPQERWHWVMAGVELLRDKGLVYNPKALELYKELSWIYLHKMSNRLDDMHVYFKRYQAARFQRVLGAPPQAGGTGENAAWLAPIVEAPTDRAELLADEEIADYVAQLAGCDVRLDLGLLDAYNKWSLDSSVKMIGQPVPQAQGRREEDLLRLMTDPEHDRVRAATVAFVRRKVLVETYRLQPQWMLQMIHRFGPLDWRTTLAHGLYWSTYGVHICEGQDITSIDAVNTDRIVLDCLKQLIPYGRITLTYNPHDPSLPSIYELPDWRFIDVCQDEHVAMHKYITGKPIGEKGPTTTGHLNWLEETVTRLFMAGRFEKAQYYLQFVRDNYAIEDPKWDLDLEDFAIASINSEGVPRRQVIYGIIHRMIERAYIAALTNYREDANIAMSRAAWFRRRYNEDVASEKNRLEPFGFMQAQVAYSLLARQEQLSSAMDLWGLLSLPIKRFCYDPIAPMLRQRCQRENIDFDKAFPEPPGMAELRQRREESMKKGKPGQPAAEG